MTFLPPGTKIESNSGGQFLKLEEGEHRFRVLDSAIVGTEYWTEEQEDGGAVKRVPHRVKQGESIPVENVDPDNLPKTFWAFPIYNVTEKKIQTLSLTQKGLMKDLLAYTKDEDFGDPQGYDIVITRTGKGMDTRYSLIAKPPKPIDEKITKEFQGLKSSGRYDIERLWEGGYPLSSEATKDAPTANSNGKTPTPNTTDEIDLDDLKF